MTMTYTSNIKVGDHIIVTDGDIQVVREIHPAGGKNAAIKFDTGTTMIVGLTTQVPVVKSNVDITLPIDKVYNLILDDNMSLKEFTIWCASNR